MQRFFVNSAVLSALALMAAREAQAGELVAVQAQTTAPAEYDAPSPQTVSANALELAASLPIEAGQRTYVLPGLGYRLEAPRFVDPPANGLPIPVFHDVEAHVSVVHAFDERWSLFVRGAVGLAGDLHAVDAGVVRFGASALAQRRFSERFAIGLGVAADYSFGELLPLPLVKLDWKTSRRTSLEGVLPLNLRFVWRPVDEARTGLIADLDGNEYAVRNASVRRNPPCSEPGGRSQCWDHLAATDLRVGALIGIRLHRELWAELRGGASVYRRFELLNPDDGPVTGGDQRLPVAPFALAQVSYEF